MRSVWDVTAREGLAQREEGGLVRIPGDHRHFWLVTASLRNTLSVEQVNLAAEYGPQPNSHNTTEVNKDQVKYLSVLYPQTICRKRCDSVRAMILYSTGTQALF